MVALDCSILDSWLLQPAKTVAKQSMYANWRELIAIKYPVSVKLGLEWVTWSWIRMTSAMTQIEHKTENKKPRQRVFGLMYARRGRVLMGCGLFSLVPCVEFPVFL